MISPTTAWMGIYLFLGLCTLPIAQYFRIVRLHRFAPFCVILAWPLGLIAAGFVAWVTNMEEKTTQKEWF